MAPSPSPDALPATPLLDTASASIRHGLEHGRPLAVDAGAHAGRLARPGAAFVTLTRDGALRGCIGSLEPRRPLIVDVAENAWAAAFRDPRFPPVGPHEIEWLHISISVLGEPESLSFESEALLLAQVEPGVHGLILAEGRSRATFLPSVWKDLPEPRRVLGQLKRKAGLPEGYWSDTLCAWRYTVETCGD